jgi:hypothetical protein
VAEKAKHFLALPACIIALPLAFYVILMVFDISLDEVYLLALVPSCPLLSAVIFVPCSLSVRYSRFSPLISSHPVLTYTPAQARAGGWLEPVTTPPAFWQVFEMFKFWDVHWEVIPTVLPTWFGMVSTQHLAPKHTHRTCASHSITYNLCLLPVYHP